MAPASSMLTAEDLSRYLEAAYTPADEGEALPEERKAVRVEGMRRWLLGDTEAEAEAACTSTAAAARVEVEALPGGLDGAGIIAKNVLSRDECKRIIDATERLGYGVLGRSRTGAAYRGNTRVQVVDGDATGGADDASPSFSARLWRRIAHLIPSLEVLEDGTWRATGLNDFYRFAKYTKGQGFAKHVDKQTVLEHDRCSVLTINVYLNDIEESRGGRTRFYAGRNGLGRPVASAGGEAGSVAIFKQTAVPTSPWHDGEVLGGGLKYLMRTDVMYALVEEGAQA